jgi:hypothetical protein
MTIKDYVYLGLILLTALAFYCNGFYAGVCRSKRVYETLLDDAEEEKENERAAHEPMDGKSLAPSEKEVGSDFSFSRDGTTISGKQLRGNFGHN